jgi:hypothetical protein
MIPTKNRDEVIKRPRSVGSSCSNSGTRCAILVAKPVISHERGKDKRNTSVVIWDKAIP